MRVLENCEPKRVFYYFEEICKIPHGSRNTKQISDYLVNFAKDHGFDYVQDELNNVVIYKPATAGYENAPTVILQGHMDMVCEKRPDVEHDFEPKYITIRGKGEILAALRKEVKKADKVYLATDPDREGEAISWHLSKALKLEDKDIYRITFNEITKSAVKAAIKDARKIDMNLVDAQQARRVLDRVVGYSISPVLWAKIKRGLSAGRVQSVALRIICDRENEIDAFIPDEY